MENHHFSWENPLKLVIFHCYVSSPEGIHLKTPQYPQHPQDLYASWHGESDELLGRVPVSQDTR